MLERVYRPTTSHGQVTSGKRACVGVGRLCKVQSVDHPCHQCQSSVEEGVPFCPRCGAPQIRVSVPEGNEPVTPPMPPGTPGNLQPPATPVFPTFPDPRKINWRIALMPAALAGVMAGFLMFVPYISILFFVWMFLAGLLAVLVYRNRSGQQVTFGMGAKIGAVVGFFAFLITGLFYVGAWLTDPEKVREAMKQGMQMSARSTDPQQAKMMQDLLAKVSSPEGMPIFLTVVMIFLFGFLVVLCAVGGAAGSTIGRKNRQA